MWSWCPSSHLAYAYISAALIVANAPSPKGLTLILQEPVNHHLMHLGRPINKQRLPTISINPFKNRVFGIAARAAWRIEQGSKARQDISIAKIHVSQLLNRVTSDAIQICGARGYSKDTVLEWIYRYGRQALLVDGATEVHQMVINRFLQNQGQAFWGWGVGND